MFSLRLIEPDSNVSLPMLSEMVVRDHVVMLYHHKIDLININKIPTIEIILKLITIFKSFYI